MNKNMKAIIEYLDHYLTQNGLVSINPVQANTILERAGLLRDNKDRPGKPLRDLLRKGQIPHAFQAGGKGSGWTIPHSSKKKIIYSNYPTSTQPKKRFINLKINQKLYP